MSFGFGSMPVRHEEDALARLFNVDPFAQRGTTLTQDTPPGVPMGLLDRLRERGDLASMFGAAPMGPGQSFGQADQTPVADAFTPDQPQPLEMRVRSAAPAIASMVGQPPPDMPAAPMSVPMPPRRPFGFGREPVAPSQLDMPVASASLQAQGAPSGSAPQASSPQPAPAAGEGESFLSRLGRPEIYNTLLGIGTGLMSTPGWGAGLASGIGNASKLNTQQSATNLANAELALKRQKLAKEARTENLTVQSIMRLNPGISAEEATARAANPAYVNELLKGTLPASEAYKVETDGAGNQFSVNSRTGQRTLLLKADDNKTTTMIPETERVALGLPPGAYQRDTTGKVSSVNAGGTTITMGAEKAQDATVGKGYGEYQLDITTKGRNASSTLNTLSVMEQAARDPKFYSGIGAEYVKKGNQALVALGVKDANYSSPTEVFDALSNKVVLDGLGGSLGPGISNTDRDYIGRTAPSLERTEQGNLELIGIARSLAQRQQQVAKLARDYAKRNGGRLDAGWDDELEAFSSSNPLFPAAKDASTAVPAAVAGAPAAPNAPALPAGAPAGTRRAPDGNYYAPDPNRPGKYLKVQ